MISVANPVVSTDTVPDTASLLSLTQSLKIAKLLLVNNWFADVAKPVVSTDIEPLTKIGVSAVFTTVTLSPLSALILTSKSFGNEVEYCV